MRGTSPAERRPYDIRRPNHLPDAPITPLESLIDTLSLDLGLIAG
jgi:hypothetical protein